MTYTPDRWVLLKIVYEHQTCYKVLAGWSGSYLYGDSWKLNSGCQHVTQDKDYYEFAGYSGSIYRCRKDMRGLTILTADILSQLETKYPDNVEIVPENIDFLAEINK